MGYAKYYEDDNEIMLGRMKYSQDYHKTNSHIQHYICPYCNLAKDSKNNLFEHIKKEHNISHPVIVVNGKVINQEEYIVAAIESLNVFTYGFADELFLNDEKYYCSETDDIDLTHQAKNIFDSENTINISIGGKRLIIKKYSISEIRTELMNPIINDWDCAICQGNMIEFNLQQSFNDVERKYLEGFYNYFLACISTKEDKTKRYYDAYNIFREFYTIDSLGICVLKVIAFKFNWISSLLDFCNLVSDEFNSICNFYYERYESIETVTNNCHKHLYIEDDIREFIDVINDYMSGNLAIAEKYVEKYRPKTVSDINQKDRILVLLNRLAQSKNDIKKAQYYKEQILSPDLKNI